MAVNDCTAEGRYTHKHMEALHEMHALKFQGITIDYMIMH